MRIKTISIFGLGLGLVAACGDDAATPDAHVIDARPIDGAPDAGPPPLGFSNPEGGEIRLEWIQKTVAGPAVQTTARATAFFYKTETPANHMIPSFPGCVDVSARPATLWPLAVGTNTPLDVGTVTISSTGTDLVLTKDTASAPTNPCLNTNGTANTGCDFLGRFHSLVYKKAPAFGTPGDGDTFLPQNQTYTIKFGGSSEWPAQTFMVPFMPAAWTPVSPAPGTFPTGTGANAPVQLVADTPLVLTFSGDTSTPPPGYQVNTAVAFTANGFVGPIVICQTDGTSNNVTVPANLVNLLRAHTPGTFVRQHLTHKFLELNDGTMTPAPADRKRIDVLTIWCFNDNWAAAP